MDEILELKQEYNKYLLRHSKAFIYLEDNNISINEREKWLPEYKRIVYHLNRILNKLELKGVHYTLIEGLGGFDIEDQIRKVS